MPNPERLAEKFLNDLFVNDALGYQGVDAKILQSEGMQAIKRNIELLDKKKQEKLYDDLHKFHMFHELSADEKKLLVKVAQQRSVSVADVYRPRDASRS